MLQMFIDIFEIRFARRELYLAVIVISYPQWLQLALSQVKEPLKRPSLLSLQISVKDVNICGDMQTLSEGQGRQALTVSSVATVWLQGLRRTLLGGTGVASPVPSCGNARGPLE